MKMKKKKERRRKREEKVRLMEELQRLKDYCPVALWEMKDLVFLEHLSCHNYDDSDCTDNIYSQLFSHLFINLT